MFRSSNLITPKVAKLTTCFSMQFLIEDEMWSFQGLGREINAEINEGVTGLHSDRALGVLFLANFAYLMLLSIKGDGTSPWTLDRMLTSGNGSVSCERGTWTFGFSTMVYISNAWLPKLRSMRYCNPGWTCTYRVQLLIVHSLRRWKRMPVETA